MGLESLDGDLLHNSLKLALLYLIKLSKLHCYQPLHLLVREKLHLTLLVLCRAHTKSWSLIS